MTTTDLHYYDVGYGRCRVLLIHGWASSARMWTSVMDTMRPLATFTAVDLIGYGKSPRPEYPPGIAAQTDAVVEFCQTHDYTPDVIIGHSMGGMITLKLLHQHPQMAQRVVLICPVVTGNYGYRSLASNFFKTPLGLAALRSSGQDIIALTQNPLLIETVVHALRDVSNVAKRIEDDYLDIHPPTAIQGLISMTEENMQPYLGEITHPALVIGSTGDFTVPPEEAQRAADGLPAAELVMVDEARHHPHDENPAATLPVIARFLQQSPAS